MLCHLYRGYSRLHLSPANPQFVWLNTDVTYEDYFGHRQLDGQQETLTASLSLSKWQEVHLPQTQGHILCHGTILG